MPTTAEACEELLEHLRAKVPVDQRKMLNGSFWDVMDRILQGKQTKNLRKSLHHRVSKELRYLRDRTAVSDPLLPRLQWLIACHAVLAALQFSNNKHEAKIHHWVPASYVRRFSVDIDAPATERRKARVWELEVSGAGRQIVESQSFAHQPIGDSGFYTLASELFFSRIEGDASETVAGVQDGKYQRYQHLSAAAMMLVHEVRAPKSLPIKIFKRPTFRQVINDMGKRIDSLENLYVYFDQPNERLPFTTFRTIRRRELVNGQMAWYFPLAPHIAVIASERGLSYRKRAAVVKAGRAGAIALARRNKYVPLYGFAPEELHL